MERRRLKQLEKLEAESEAEKQRNLRMIELEHERIKDTRYNILQTNEYQPE